MDKSSKNEKNSKNGRTSSPIPTALLAAMAGPGEKLPKRERTRRQILLAAIGVLKAKGLERASIQEIAVAAGVANGTFYNHFPTKEALLEAMAIWLVQQYSDRLAEGLEAITDGAERMAIANRRYMQLGMDDPEGTAFFLDLTAQSAALRDVLRPYVLADLELGIAQKRFQVSNKRAALDVIMGGVRQAMYTIAAGEADAGYPVVVATAVLRALGVPAADAAEVARRPLPRLTPVEPVESGGRGRVRR